MSAENSFVCINASTGCIFAIGSGMPDYPVDGNTSLFTWGEKVSGSVLDCSSAFASTLSYINR